MPYITYVTLTPGSTTPGLLSVKTCQIPSLVSGPWSMNEASFQKQASGQSKWDVSKTLLSVFFLLNSVVILI